MNYTGPKVRLSRRLGVAFTPKAERIMQKKNYPPGMHGPGLSRRRGKESVYKRQLMEKQKVRTFFNIHERQMRNIYRKAARRSLNTADGMIEMLETRLDAVVARGGFARTIYASRQLVAHGHVTVNGKKVDIASYAVKPGDIVGIREKSRKMKALADALAGSPAQPPYVELNKEDVTIKLLDVPKQGDIPILRDVDLSLVVEFYSR